jgi:hypothetical protein
MDENQSTTDAQRSTSDEGKPIFQPPNAHQLAVEALAAKLQAIQEEIPHFTLPDSKSATRRLNPLASVPAEFIVQMLSAARNYRSLTPTTGETPQEIADLMDFANAYEIFTSKLRNLTGATAHTVALAHSKVALWALHTYAVAKRIARRPEGADLVGLIPAWREALGRGRRKAPRVKPAPEE